MRATTSLALSILSLLLLALGCTAREELSLDEPPAESTAAITLGMRLADHTQPSPLLRGEGDIWYDKSRTYLINGLRIVLYKQDPEGNPTEVAYAFDKDIYSFRDERHGADLLNPEDKGPLFVVKGMSEITPADYTIILFTSPSKAIRAATAVGQSYDELRKPLEEDFLRSLPGQEESHLLSFASPIFSTATNVDSPAHVTKEALVESSSTTPVDLGPISLRAVDGMVVIRSQYDVRKQDEEIKLHISGSHMFFPDVLNRSVLLFPDKDTSASGTLTVPMDQNYSGMRDWDADRLGQEFFYMGKDLGKHLLSIYGYDSARDGTGMSEPIVVPENTTSPSDARSRVVTHIIARIGVRPVTFANLPDPGEDRKGTWFTYEGKDYDYVTFGEAYNQVLNRLKKAGGNMTTLTEADQELLRMGRDVLQSFDSEKEVPIGAPLTSPPTQGATSDKVKLYGKGTAYYLIPVRHYDDDQAPSVKDIGRYGVVRNTLYQITIRSIEHIGAPTLDTLPEEVDYSTVVPGDITIGLSDRVVIDNNVAL